MPTAGATLEFERTLWQGADALRGSMDAAEYKHAVLGLLFPNLISGAIDEEHAQPKSAAREATWKNLEELGYGG